MCELLCTFFVDFPVENNEASKKNNSNHINNTLISPSQTRYNHPTCNTTSTHVTAAANQHDIAEDLNKQRLVGVRTRDQHTVLFAYCSVAGTVSDLCGQEAPGS